MKKRFDPLLFDDLRAQVDFALGRPPGPEATAALGAATRRILEADVGHASISRACERLGWRDELATALAAELAAAADAHDAASLREIGERVRRAYEDHAGEIGSLVARTSERLGEPASVVAVALALARPAAEAHGGPMSALGRAADAAIEEERRVRADEVLPTGAGIVHALAGQIATQPGCAAVHGIEDASESEPRAECAERIEAWLVGWLDEHGQSAACPPVARAAIVGWAAWALSLLPASDVAVRNAVRAIAHLPDAASRAEGWLGLLGAALPRALSVRDAVAVRHGDLCRALVLDAHGIVRLEGGADLEASLPVDARAPFRAAARRWALDARPRGVVRSAEGTSTMERREALPGIDVTVGAERCMGETRYSITFSGREVGAPVTLLDESPDLVAVDRAGRGVWIQSVDASGARRCELRALGRHTPPPWPAHPPRAAAILVTELLGPRCPGRGASAPAAFAFAEDAPPGT